jgi:hypothetical protein
MSNMASYARIFKLEPDDDYVRKRQSAVDALVRVFAELNPASDAIELASSIAAGLETRVVPQRLADMAAKAISAASDSFVQDGEHLQMLVCAMAAAEKLILNSAVSRGSSVADFLAAALWSALSFQPADAEPQVENLRGNLLAASVKRASAVALTSRQRVPVPEVGKLSIPESTPTGTRANTAFREATAPLVAALRENAELDREEIDLLWWVLSEYSDTLKRPMSSFDEVARAIVAGVEGGAKLRKIPSDGHRNLLLRGISAGDEVALGAVIDRLGEDGKELAAPSICLLTKRAVHVFPLLTAIATGVSQTSGGEVAYSKRAWGARALLEASLVAVTSRQVAA